MCTPLSAQSRQRASSELGVRSVYGNDMEYQRRFGSTREQMLARTKHDIERGLVKVTTLPEDEILNEANVLRCIEAGLDDDAIRAKLHCSQETLLRLARRAGYIKRFGEWARTEPLELDAPTVAKFISQRFSSRMICEKFGIDMETFRRQLADWGKPDDMKMATWARLYQGDAEPAEPEGEPETPPVTASDQTEVSRPETEPVPDQVKPKLTYEALEAAILAGKTNPQLAKMFGVDLETIKYRKRRWRLIGMSQHGPGSRQRRRMAAETELTEEPIPAAAEAASADKGVVSVENVETRILEETDSLTDMIRKARKHIERFRETEDECNAEINALIGVVVRCVRKREALERMIVDLEEPERQEAAS